MFKKILNFVLWIVRAIFSGTARAQQKAEENRIAGAGDRQKKTVTKVVTTEDGGKRYIVTHYEDGSQERKVIEEDGDAEINNASDFNAGR